MQRLLSFLVAFFLLSPLAFAKTLTKIDLLPPPDGYHLAGLSSTAQLTPLCTYDDATTDNCSTLTLTWGSTNDSAVTVSSSGLVSYGPGYGGTITSIVRSGGVVTVTTTSTFRVPLYVPLMIQGATDSSFDGTYAVNTDSATSASNTITYLQAGPDATSSGGGLYFAGGADVYAYSGTILGHQGVQVDASIITSILIRPENASSNTIVQGSTVLVSAEDSTNNPVDGGAIGDICAWTSSNPSVASIDYIGNVTGVSPGSATITCTLAGITATRDVTVTNPTLANKIWYVRYDGGTVKDANVPAGQCDGTLNVPLAGSTDSHCAVNNPMYLITDETSSTVYTGLVGPGDTAIITPKADGTPYLMGSRSQNDHWVSGGPAAFPSGTPAQPTRILGSNYASCSSISAMTKLENYFSGGMFGITGVQNLDVECLDMSNWSDCNQGLQNNISFACPTSLAAPDGYKSQIPFVADTFSSNILLKNMYIHGFTNGWDGTPGPGLVMDHVTTKYGWQAGIDFDNPFGYNGNRTNGFTATYLESSYNGGTEEQPKTVTSVSRDGIGNLTVTFSSDQMVNYQVGTNLVLTGMTPTDLNGTFSVRSITFNQQTVNITGGSCDGNIGSTAALVKCTITTDAAPAFNAGSFVQIAGANPTFLNGDYEVFTTSSSGFVVAASNLTRLGWTAATISSGGTASTALSLTASSSGSSETASVLGTASHVIPAHRFEDQYDSGYADGDGVGTGNNTIGKWSCDHCTFIANMQDGWDMLHSAMRESIYTNSYSAENEGAPAKFGNADIGIFHNNVGIGNCASMLAFNSDRPPDFNQYLATPCRGGDTFPFNSRMWSNMSITNNTWVGTFNTMLDDGCSDANGCTSLPAFEKAEMQNNLWIGYQDTNSPYYSGVQPGMYCGSSCNNTPYTNMAWVWTNNYAFNVRIPQSGTGNNWNINPLVKQLIPDIFTFADESKSLSYNVDLQTTSPLLGAGVENADVPATDSHGTTRPNPPSIGAYEYWVGTLISITVTPSTGTIYIPFTKQLTGTCSYTSGNTTPCNITWTGTGAHSSVGTSTGVVTAVSPGSDTITATIDTISGTATVTIANPPPFVRLQGIAVQGSIQ